MNYVSGEMLSSSQFFLVALSYILISKIHIRISSYGFLLLLVSIHHPVNLNIHANILVLNSVQNSLHKTILKTESAVKEFHWIKKTHHIDRLYLHHCFTGGLILRTPLFTVTLAVQSYLFQKLSVQITLEGHSSWDLSFNLHCNSLV